MSGGSRPSIVITKEELKDHQIDEALDLQRNYVPNPVEAAEPKFRLLYSAWFYLLLAGALGAFLAWAMLEPKFHDVITFTGKIEELNPDRAPSNFRGNYEIQGYMKVAGVDVYIMPQFTKIRAAGAASRLSIRELNLGEVVTVFGEVAPGSPNTILAAAVRLNDPRTAVDTDVNVSSLDTQQKLFGFLLLPVVAAMVGLTIGGVEGIICRTYSRAAWCASIGLLTGLIGGAVSAIAAGIVFVALGAIGPSGDPRASGVAFLFLMFRRGLAWTIAGMAMGLGQGFALKSRKLKFNGFIGGMIGGLIGGLLFEPVNLIFLGPDGISAANSRAVGLTIVGAAVGLLIGLTDLLTRDAWLKVLSGPLQGKEFSFNQTPIRLGSSPKNEIYLFKDPKIDPIHAEIYKLRDAYEIVDNGSSTGTFVNGRRVARDRLADGARIKVGDSEFSYSSRENKAG